MVLLIAAACETEKLTEDETPRCLAANHCLSDEHGVPRCDNGFVWVNPDDPDDLRCREDVPRLKIECAAMIANPPSSAEYTHFFVGIISNDGAAATFQLRFYAQICGDTSSTVEVGALNANRHPFRHEGGYLMELHSEAYIPSCVGRFEARLFVREVGEWVQKEQFTSMTEVLSCPESIDLDSTCYVDTETDSCS